MSYVTIQAFVPESLVVDYSQQLLQFAMRYGYSDFYFYYLNQKIFLIKLGQDFLDYKSNWQYLNLNVLTLYPYVINDENTSGQYWYESQFYQESDLLFVPFNFLTNDDVYTTNCAYSRAADNSYVQLFAIGGVVVSYARDGVPSEEYGDPFPVCVYTEEDGAGNLMGGQTKLVNDGVPYATNVSNVWLGPYNNGDALSSSLVNYDQIFVYPAKKSGFKSIFSNVETSILPGVIVEFEAWMTGGPPRQYFILELPKRFQALGADLQSTSCRRIDFDYQDVNFPTPSLILLARKPLIGLDNLFGWNEDGQKNYVYRKVLRSDLSVGLPTRNVDNSISIINNTNYLYIRTRTEGLNNLLNIEYQPDTDTDSDTQSMIGWISQVNSMVVTPYDAPPTPPANTQQTMVPSDGWFIFPANSQKHFYGVPSAVSQFLTKYDGDMQDGQIQCVQMSNKMRNTGAAFSDSLQMAPHFIANINSIWFNLNLMFNFSINVDYVESIEAAYNATNIGDVWKQDTILINLSVNLPTTPQRGQRNYECDPMKKFGRIFRGFEDHYPYVRADNVNMLMMQLEPIKSFAQFIQPNPSENKWFFSLDGQTPYTFGWVSPIDPYYNLASLKFFSESQWQSSSNSLAWTAPGLTKFWWGQFYLPLSIWNTAGEEFVTYDRVVNKEQFQICVEGTDVAVMRDHDINCKIFLMFAIEDQD